MRDFPLPKTDISRFFYTVALLAALIGLASCEPQEEILTDDPDIRLTFSTDTVSFDTVFSTIGTVTKRLKVYNPSRNAVQVSRIKLAGQGSPFSLIVNGRVANEVENMRILGRDSLLILVKATIDPQNEDLPFLVKDSVVFQLNGGVQDVKIVAYGQDAVFFRNPGRESLPCGTVWTAQRPYVVLDTLVVLPNCELQMEAGTRVFFGPRAAILVAGTLKVEGTIPDPVQLQAIRQEDGYDDLAGQWGGIFFIPGSKGNQIERAIIRNGTTGLYLGSPNNDIELTVANTVIQHMANAGIFAINSTLSLTNSLISDCATYTLAIQGGGDYSLVHNTLAAVSARYSRDQSSFVATNFLNLGNSVLRAPLNLVLRNNIIWGRLPEELLLVRDPNEGIAFNIVSANNLFKTRIAAFNTPGNVVNKDPLFLDPFAYDYHLDTLGKSPAINAGFPVGIRTDLDGTPRDLLPDLGAYEFVEK